MNYFPTQQKQVAAVPELAKLALQMMRRIIILMALMQYSAERVPQRVCITASNVATLTGSSDSWDAL